MWRPGYTGPVVYPRPGSRPGPGRRRRRALVAAGIVALGAVAAGAVALVATDPGRPATSATGARIPSGSCERWSVTLDAPDVPTVGGSTAHDRGRHLRRVARRRRPRHRHRWGTVVGRVVGRAGRRRRPPRGRRRGHDGRRGWRSNAPRPSTSRRVGSAGSCPPRTTAGRPSMPDRSWSCTGRVGQSRHARCSGSTWRRARSSRRSRAVTSRSRDRAPSAAPVTRSRCSTVSRSAHGPWSTSPRSGWPASTGCAWWPRMPGPSSPRGPRSSSSIDDRVLSAIVLTPRPVADRDGRAPGARRRGRFVAVERAMGSRALDGRRHAARSSGRTRRG